MAQAANYYEKDDYYTRSSDNADTWQGKLSQCYGQRSQLTAGEFNAALKSMPNPERAAIDLTFSAPKSVSVAMVLDETKKADMIAAHNKAVTDTLDEIEKNEIETRITKNGITERVKTGNMAAAKFNHYVSRNQDMQLHTHAVILNRTEYNGKLYAISNENLYENHILYGQLYRNRLAANLQDMGYKCNLTDNQKGFFELEGIDEATLQHFSSRRAEILEKLKEWNIDSAGAADRATLLTRSAKVNKDLKLLEQSWREQLKDENIQLQKSKVNIKSSAKTEAFDRAVARLSEKQFAFTAKELERAALAEGCTTGMDRENFQTILKKSKIVRLESLGEDQTIYYTTKENIQIEQEISKNIKSSVKIKPIGQAKIKLKEMAKAENLTLNTEQESAVLHIAQAQKQYVAVQGLAGTGKTYMLNAARQLFEENGYKVKGMSFTGKAAEGLQNEALIQSSTLHSFFNKLEKEAGNAPKELTNEIKNSWNFKGLKAGKELWIVDEAGMTDNNLILHLQRAAKLKKAKVVLVGDYKQLQPVGTGNAYAKFVQNKEIPVYQLSEILRQKDAKDANLLEAVKEAVSGDIDKSLELLKEHTKEIKSPQKRFKAIAEEYAELSPEAQNETLVLTAKNKDRVFINDQIREKLIKSGQITKGQEIKVTSAQSEEVSRNFAPNDKIVFLKNDYKLGVRNGQTGKLLTLDSESMTVNSNGQSYKVNLAEYNSLDHGYCVTTHKAQGMTVDKAIINVDSTQKALNTRNSYYVDVSRARNSVSIYTDDKTKLNQQVGQWMKKITSDDFLIRKSGIKAKLPSMPKMPTLPIPVLGPLLNIPIKAVEIGFKVGMKAVSTAIKLPGKLAKLEPKAAQNTIKQKGRHM
ncbi:MAG: TrwC relaxase [Firmicutes bacterium]|nr:TrwC relaxase [Bacillota bacterium]